VHGFFRFSRTGESLIPDAIKDKLKNKKTVSNKKNGLQNKELNFYRYPDYNFN
jgi:hypothetical protein